MQKIIDDFKDIISNGRPLIIPHKRSISHQIDFVSSASLPKKVAYKLTPDQNKEVARQVQELLDQGMIKKTISPCVVIVVLVAKKGGKCRLCIDSMDIN